MERVYFITGWSGFIGRNIVKKLISNKKKVFLIEINGRRNERIFTNVEYLTEYKLEKVSGIFQNSVLIHAAYNSDVSSCQEKPIESVNSNINLTIRILDLCKKLKITNFIFLSTGFLYGDNEIIAHKETDQLIANNFYLSTKLISEKIIEYNSMQSEVNSLVLRLGNVFGSESKDNTVIGRILKQINSSSSEVRLHTLKPSRDFIYIDDVMDAIEIIASKKFVRKFDVINLSSGISISIKQIIECIFDIKKIHLPIKEERHALSGYNSSILLDISKIYEIYQWKPKYSFESAIKKIIDTYE